MTQTPPPATTLPHHKLIAYALCLVLVKLIAKTRIANAQLHAQARKSAASAALNCAEGAARQTRADKSRAYAIALCECCEACAAIEIAGALGACSVTDVQAVAKPALRHRIASNYAAQAAQVDSEKLIEMLMEAVPADRKYERPAA